MHDIAAIVKDPDAFDAALARRGLPSSAASLVAQDRSRRRMIQAADEARAARNEAAREAAMARARGDEAGFAALCEKMAARKAETARLEAESKAADEALTARLMELPNLPRDDVPVGKDERDNVEIRRFGAPRRFAFTPREHFALGEALGLMDFETSAKLSGARFMVLSGALARLHRALGQFMIDLHVSEHGLVETWVPVLVNGSCMEGTGQLPKFAADSFKTGDGRWLIPTAEVPLTNIVRAAIVPERYLPRRYVAWTQCFRSEAGSAGRDTRGILRQHQFEKVEMVSAVRPEDSERELQRMTRCAETVLERLALPYRTVVLSTGDMGFGAQKTHDIEVWLPGQDCFREISSCSLCGDFQARRMNARFRREERKKAEYLHTLNGSGLAVGRALIAVMENCQRADGGIDIPAPLRAHMGGANAIGADGRLSGAR